VLHRDGLLIHWYPISEEAECDPEANYTYKRLL